jgi:L-ascorbate metabolism protein UlaG (beta-lactamase superfamily)
MKFTMIGHSTVLIEAAGERILTDPYFGARGNPAYARKTAAAKSREELKAVDLVLVSHNHFDHTDRAFFRLLGEDTPVYAPRGSAWATRLKGATSVVGLREWEMRQFGPLRITAVPARHITFTRGYVVEEEGRTVYFAGDTYYGEFMKEIGAKFAIDVALMPVTTFRIPMTMSETSAVEAVRALKPRVVIPIHLGIGPRSPLMRTKQTPEGFQQRVLAAGLNVDVKILREGESWDLVSSERELELASAVLPHA